MTRIGPWIFMKAANYPAFLKAEKLARTLSYNDIEEILNHHVHIHRNPKRREPPVPYPGEEEIYPTAGE